MPYYTQADQVVLKMNVERIIQDSKLIKGIIERDRVSKAKEDMTNGVRYYNEDHDILKKDFRKYIVDGTNYLDENAANNRVSNPFHQELVDQKREYILANSLTISSEKGELAAKIKEFQTEKLSSVLDELVINASNKGFEWVHPFIDEDGVFDYTIIPAEQIVPDYDSTYKNKLISVLRYYPVEKVDESGRIKEIYKVEIWDSKTVTFFIQDDKENFIRDAEETENPRPHFRENFKQGDKIISSKAKDWGRPPFILLPNNIRMRSDLNRIKGLIDVYDLIFSGFANNVEDIQDAIWNLKEFEGTDLKEFMTNMRKFKAIKTSGNGGVEPHTLEIPVDAKTKLLEIIERNIYRFGSGIDLSDQNFAGDQSGVAIKFKYARLDMKANAVIIYLKAFIKTLFRYWLIGNRTDIKFNDSEIEITFSKAMIVNVKEQIENVQNSVGILSDETLLENHPFVKDTAKERQRKKDEGVERNVNLDNVTTA